MKKVALRLSAFSAVKFTVVELITRFFLFLRFFPKATPAAGKPIPKTGATTKMEAAAEWESAAEETMRAEVLQHLPKGFLIALDLDPKPIIGLNDFEFFNDFFH